MRLPTELEWLLSSQNTNFHWGDVWEWTSNTFSEFPDFVPHPYKDYSKPWFDGQHKTVKGASFATCEISVTYIFGIFISLTEQIFFQVSGLLVSFSNENTVPIAWM